MSNPLHEIKIADIDLADQRYKISLSEYDISFLALSIKETGLISPPIVRPLENKVIIVSGFNRIRAYLVNNETKIPVYKTKPDIDEYQCLLTAITQLSFKRPLTHAELILSIKRLNKFLNEKQIRDKSPAIFNMELNLRFIEDLLNIGALPDPAPALIHNGNLSFKSAKKISLFEKDTIDVFLNIFSKIKASNNKQLEIILHIMEISAREGIKPKDLYSKKIIKDILFNENKDPWLKTRDLRTCLFEQRFPALSKTRKTVQKKITGLKLNKKIKFMPPENFESRDFNISFTAKTHDEFTANIRNLVDALENDSLKEIF
ncbi:MAG: ParB N-terminal domain-containing protein [Deltaproteobacteria bacterium]|nr:ParB N-terminal domain-containing protein [Deltaproteobacteria bacterium]